MTKEDRDRKREQDAKDQEAIRKGREAKNWKRREDAINDAAAKEAAERLEDDFLSRQFQELTGIDTRMAEEILRLDTGSGVADPEAVAAQEAIMAAKEAMRSGVFKSPNPDKAKGIIRKNRNAIRNTVKKNRKGCKIFALGLLALGSGVLYGMYEGASALAGWVF